MDQLELDREKTDNRDAVEAVESNEPPVAEEPTKPLSLAQKIVAIRKQCAGIGKEPIDFEYFDKKSGSKKNYSIQAHTIEGVLVAVRHLLNEHQVIVTPNLVERGYNGNRCDAIFDFIWECAESGDTRTIRYAGADIDNGGKGFAKAGTNALKEHLKKFLLITDRDDAKEETEHLEHQTAETVSRKAAEKARDDVRAMFHAWATNFTNAVKTCPDVKSLGALERENAEQMDNPDLPEVTRKHLKELCADRRAVLKEFEAEAAKDNEETLA